MIQADAEKRCCSSMRKMWCCFFYLNHANVFEQTPKINDYNMGTLKLKPKAESTAVK